MPAPVERYEEAVPRSKGLLQWAPQHRPNNGRWQAEPGQQHRGPRLEDVLVVVEAHVARARRLAHPGTTSLIRFQWESCVRVAPVMRITSRRCRRYRDSSTTRQYQKSSVRVKQPGHVLSRSPSTASRTASQTPPEGHNLTTRGATCPAIRPIFTGLFENGDPRGGLRRTVLYPPELRARLWCRQEVYRSPQRRPSSRGNAGGSTPAETHHRARQGARSAAVK